LVFVTDNQGGQSSS